MKFKKALCLVLATLMFGTMFTACGSTKEADSKDDGKKVTITYWQHSSAARDKMMQTLGDEFKSKNSNIDVKFEFIPEADYSTKLTSALATDSAPDVMQVESGSISTLAKADVIQPLNTSVLPTSTIKKDFIPATVDGLQVNGKYYGMPTDTETIVLYWNKDLLSAAGLDAEKGPQTWAEIKDWAKKLTKTDASGKMAQAGWGEKGYHPEVQAFINSNGGKMVDSKGNYVFADDAKSVEAIQFLVDEYKTDKVYDTKFMANWAGFRQGKVAIMCGHPAMLGNLKQTAPNIKIGIGQVPTINGKRKTVVTSWAYVISKKANSKAATKFIQYITSSDVEKRWTKETGELPALKSLVNDKDLTSDPQVKILLSSLNDSTVGYLQTAALGKIWSDGYQKLILTNASTKDTLKQMQTDMNAEIQKSLK